VVEEFAKRVAEIALDVVDKVAEEQILAEIGIPAVADRVYMAAVPTARLEAIVVVADHTTVEIVRSLLAVAAYTSPSTSTLLCNG